MEGYSVTEAASILGVPTERVWELLARGVLAGAPEGETGMRVYLQPRPAPAPPVAEAGWPNGNGGGREPERELSPFRELLTEFRNLTERYGQALLALGEARGEVAALRSRVDLLEARMDLRLPMTPAPMTAPTPWPAPMPAAPAADEAPVRDAAGEEAEDEEERPRRRRAHRRATESFAEALARAEDPTRPELPGAAETAAALAALREESHAEAAEAVLPRELPAAEPILSAEEPEAPTVQAADETETTAEAVAATGEEPTLEPELISEPEAAVAPLAEPLPAAEAIDEPELQPAAEAEPAVADAVAVPEHAEESPAPGAAPAEEQAELAEEPEPIAWDPERYTVEITEPDWYADEEVAAAAVSEDEPTPAAPVHAPEPSAPQESLDTAPAPASETDAPEIEPAAPEPVPEPIAARDDDEETMLWFGTAPEEPEAGADEMEVVGAARPPTNATAPMPGSQELDDALAALEALAHPSSSEVAMPAAPESSDEPWPPAIEPEEPVAAEERFPADRLVPPVGTVTSLTRPSATPASRAYRRLRRIFPG
jgi:hypothetical protein